MSFPITLADFTAYQEQLLHRRLAAAEQELTAIWLGIFNDIRSGELDGATVVEKLDGLIASTDDAPLLRFLKAAREWAVCAWKGVQ